MRMGWGCALRRWAVLAAVSMTGLAAAQAQGRGDGALSVGFVVDRNGPWVNASKDFFAGAKAMIDDLNARGGLNGRAVRIAVRDGDGTPARAVQAAQALARDDRVDVILGLAGDEAFSAVAADAQLRREGVVLLAPISGLPLPASAANVVFTRPDYSRETQRILQHLQGLGLSDVAMIYGPSAYAPAIQSIRQGLGVAAEGGKSSAAIRLAEYKLSADAARRNDELRGIAARRPQALVVVGDSLEFAQLYQAYRRLAPGALVVGLSSVNPRTILEVVPPQTMGGAMLSQVMIDPTRPSQALARDFDRVFRKYFDEAPSHESLAGYVAARVLVEAARRAGGAVTRASLTAALQNLSRVDVSGFELNYASLPQRGSQFVDLVMMRADGSLMQ